MSDTRTFTRLFGATVIPHAAQRYATTGDWMTREGSLPLEVRVSDMGNTDFEMLVALHETVEGWLCIKARIPDHLVCQFDKLYEEARPVIVEGTSFRSAIPVGELEALFGCTCPITEVSEPGDDIHAPYYKQHQLATSVERMLVAEVGVSWQAYEQANLDLYETGEQPPNA